MYRLRGYIILNAKPKVRTDYHELYSSLVSSDIEDRTHPWFKFALVLGIGFIIGMLYTKVFVTSSCETLALSSVSKTQSSAQENVSLQSGKSAKA
jgi:hypothetical protein